MEVTLRHATGGEPLVAGKPGAPSLLESVQRSRAVRRAEPEVGADDAEVGADPGEAGGPPEDADLGEAGLPGAAEDPGEACSDHGQPVVAPREPAQHPKSNRCAR